MTTSLLRIQAIPPDGAVRGMPETEMLQRSCTVALERLDRGRLTSCEDSLAVESDLRIHVRGRPDVVLSRTPGDDLNLVVGHLFSKSLLHTPEQVAAIGFRFQASSHVDVSLGSGKPIRRIFPERPQVRLAPERLFELKETFELRQRLFRNTGSSHAAALFSLEGHLLAFGEDVGRHNAFDKAIGRALLEGTLNRAAIAMLSSRIAVEMASKATRAGIPVLCGFSAATSAGVTHAREHGVTLVGRLRGGRFDVYANAWRLEEE